MGARPVGAEEQTVPGSTARLAKVVPGLIAAVFALPLLVAARHFGFIADVPVAVIAAGVIGGSLIASGATWVLPPGGSNHALLARLTVCFATRAVPAEQLAAVVESGFADSVLDPVVVPFRARA